jgi:hypothetical protein
MNEKRLPGAPWDERYIVRLLTRDGYDRVMANGYEYTREDKRQTGEALRLLHAEVRA